MAQDEEKIIKEMESSENTNDANVVNEEDILAGRTKYTANIKENSLSSKLNDWKVIVAKYCK